MDPRAFSQFRRQLCAWAALASGSMGAARSAPAQASEAGATSALRWVAGDLPPFAWQGSEGPQGYAYELAQLMAERLGRRDAVQFFPWARAVRMTEAGEALGVFPLARTPDREHKFRWLILLMHISYTLVGRAGSRPLDLDALRSRRVGVLRGSPIIKNLQTERFSQIIEAKDYKDLLRMLRADMLDAIYAGAPMIQAAIELNGYARSAFRTFAHLGEADLYMGCSLHVSEAEADRWQHAYQQLVADGSVARLQQRYFR